MFSTKISAPDQSPFPRPAYFCRMNAFISRDQTPESEFSSVLRAQGWQVSGQSLVQLEPLPFEIVPDCDWIFFASKNAVRFFFDQVRAQGIVLPVAKWAALGEATASALAEHVGNIGFIGNGEPEMSAKAFMETALSEQDRSTAIRVLFPAARHSMQSILLYLNNRFLALQMEVYDNQSLTQLAERREDVLVFTSPMNARAYFTQHALLPYQKVIAIGATTAEGLRDLGIEDAVIAAAPNERCLAEAVLGLRAVD